MKTALVTGASQGLGLSLCTRLISKGYFVVTLDCKISDKLNLLAGDSLQVIQCDISDNESVISALNECNSNSLDVIFNNAGIWLEQGRPKLLDEGFEFDSMLRQFDVNAVGMLRVTRAFMPLLLAGEDKVVVNISSEAGSIGQAARTSEYGYCMSKAAQNMATKILSNAFAKSGVKFYAIHPGWLLTPMGWDGATGNSEPDQCPDDAAEKLIELAESSWKDGIYYDINGNEMPW